jgi:hypothetical protein
MHSILLLNSPPPRLDYIALIPVFYLERGGQHESPEKTNHDRSGTENIVSSFWIRWFPQRSPWSRKQDPTQSIDAGEERIRKGRVKRVGVQMTSMFVILPDFKTVITYTSDKEGRDVPMTIDSRHSTSLKKCWSRVQGDLRKSYSKLRQYDGRYLAYSLLDQAVDFVGPIVKEMRTAVKVEKEELRRRKYKNMAYIHLLREELKRMSRKFKPFVRLLVHIIEDDTISSGLYVGNPFGEGPFWCNLYGLILFVVATALSTLFSGQNSLPQRCARQLGKL